LIEKLFIRKAIELENALTIAGIKVGNNAKPCVTA
jgi:hypothetical protein